MRAAADGFAEVVKMLIEFIDPNFVDSVGRPFFCCIYRNKDKASRRACLQVVLPRLGFSNEHLMTATENGDLDTVKYIVSKLKGNKGVLYYLAIRRAIEKGYDEVAKWIACEPGLMTPDEYEDALRTAAEKQNYDLLVFLSQNVPGIENCDPGFLAATQLWKFLRGRDKALFAKLVPGYPGGKYLPSR